MVVLVVALSGNAWADEYLDPIGGPGGGQFQAHCSANQFLAGFELRAADDVDAIRPLCVTVYGPRETSAASSSDWHGGIGGASAYLVCPRYTPIVTGLYVNAEGADTIVVNNIHLFCGMAAGPQTASDVSAADFDAPNYTPTGYLASPTGSYHASQQCPVGQVAVGMHGRSGIWVDAIGLICGAPLEPGKTLGRVKTSTPSSPHPSGWTICDSARDARARNSPKAPDLEAMCASLPAKTLGRVNTGKPSPPHPPGWTICDSARDARSRNSPKASDLEAMCRASGGTP